MAVHGPSAARAADKTGERVDGPAARRNPGFFGGESLNGVKEGALYQRFLSVHRNKPVLRRDLNPIVDLVAYHALPPLYHVSDIDPVVQNIPHSLGAPQAVIG